MARDADVMVLFLDIIGIHGISQRYNSPRIERILAYVSLRHNLLPFRCNGDVMKVKKLRICIKDIDLET